MRNRLRPVRLAGNAGGRLNQTVPKTKADENVILQDEANFAGSNYLRKALSDAVARFDFIRLFSQLCASPCVLPWLPPRKNHLVK